MHQESGFRMAPNWPKIGKMTITSQFANMTSYLLSWRHHHVSRVNCSYWSKFYVNIITGSGVMTIFFYEGLARNPEIGNIPSEFCPISGD